MQFGVALMRFSMKSWKLRSPLSGVFTKALTWGVGSGSGEGVVSSKYVAFKKSNIYCVSLLL